ncbi:uncharacterized protein [Arachis hypogaea]|uniref:uncharacterized protein n=1 Tax=Arachis hypogaea TaxID=3818 RepID=UPI003B21EF52
MLVVQRAEETTTRSPAIPTITFGQDDHKLTTTNLDDPVVISIQAGDLVRKVLLDPGSSADVLFYSIFQKMKLIANVMQSSSGELVGFSGERVSILGSVWLKANDDQTATVYSDQIQARQCYHESLKIKTERNPETELQRETLHVSNISEAADLDPRKDLHNRLSPTDDLEKVILNSNDNHVTYISSSLPASIKRHITDILQINADLFAWTPADMSGIDPNFICHKLQIDPKIRPIAQKKRIMGNEKRSAYLEETKKLLEAGFIKELRFTTWLSNVVMVRKASSKWRMCVDFTNLKKACPKDAYSLPCIDKLVDNASGYNVLSFLDAYSGYNQILMHPKDQDKIEFIIEMGNYCYKVMPFGHKNAGATYQ